MYLLPHMNHDGIEHLPMYSNIGEIHYHKENKTNGGKQIEFNAESNQLEIKIGNKRNVQ